MTGWTDERVERLKKLWQDGLSASQIAKQLGGVTRNAVIGKVSRLGLSGRAAPSTPRRGARIPPALPKSPPKPRPRRVATTIAMSPSVSEAFPAHLEPALRRSANEDAFAPLPGSTPRPLIDRPDHGCTWPVGEDASGQMLVCCEPVSSRWCSTHDAMNRDKAPKTTATSDLERSIRRYV
jgi:GcrA cell cycle regulator